MVFSQLDSYLIRKDSTTSKNVALLISLKKVPNH